MAGKRPGGDGGEPKDPPSVLIVEFKEPGSALFKLSQKGVVTPGQLVAVSEFLRLHGQMQYSAAIGQDMKKQGARRELSKIAIARAGMPL